MLRNLAMSSKFQNRLRHFQTHRWIDVIGVEQIRFRANERRKDITIACNWVDRWIGNLREQLLKVVVQRFELVRQQPKEASPS